MDFRFVEFPLFDYQVDFAPIVSKLGKLYMVQIFCRHQLSLFLGRAEMHAESNKEDKGDIHRYLSLRCKEG